MSGAQEKIQGVDDNEMSKDTLMSLLKEKAKELKNVQKKLKKVEEKFVEIHKEHKLIAKDRDTFIQLLKTIFSKQMLEEILVTPDN
jgi:3-methyladenine DNA glycosylase/8-oxoguanine DNA glycosylase